MSYIPLITTYIDYISVDLAIFHLLRERHTTSKKYSTTHTPHTQNVACNMQNTPLDSTERTISLCKTYRLTRQNTSFHFAKHGILHCNGACFERQYGYQKKKERKKKEKRNKQGTNREQKVREGGDINKKRVLRGLSPQRTLSTEKRQPPTLPHCIAVPSAQSGLTSLFGMGRGGTPTQ